MADFSSEDEQLLMSLFPESDQPHPQSQSVIGGMGRASTPFPPNQSGPGTRIIFIALLVAFVVAVIGVDVAYKRANLNAKGPTPPWLPMSKMAAGIASFYLTYWSLNYTVGANS